MKASGAVSTIAIGAGLAAAAGGLYLVLRRPRSEPTTSAASPRLGIDLGRGRSGFVLTGEF